MSGSKMEGSGGCAKEVFNIQTEMSLLSGAQRSLLSALKRANWHTKQPPGSGTQTSSLCSKNPNRAQYETTQRIAESSNQLLAHRSLRASHRSQLIRSDLQRHLYKFHRLRPCLPARPQSDER